jgi:flagellar biosynthesis/type III secretory pathway protein FliH
LFDFIKGASYLVFMKMREVIITGAVDAGRTAEASQKQFERQIGRISANFTVENENGVKVAYKKPVAESPDAKRKADARKAEIARLEKFEDGELLDVKAELLRKGDNKSLNEVKKINAEVTRRNADVIAENKAEIKTIVDKINARIKELVKDGDVDALTACLLAME